MTLIRVTLALVLVMAAVLLAAGCADPVSGVVGNSTSNIDTPVKLSVTITPVTTDMRSDKSGCNVSEPVPNVILSGNSFVYQSRLHRANKSINRVWIIGQKIATTNTAIPDRSITDNLIIPERATGHLKNGMYEILIEYPDTSGSFTLVLSNREYPERVMNQNGALVIDLSQVRTGGMTEKNAADAIENAIIVHDRDMLTERTTLNVTEAWIRINSISDHVIGDKFPVNGTTNIPTGEILYFQIWPADYKPTEKSMAGETSSIKYAMIPVMPGVGGCNVWGDKILIDTTYMKPGPMRATVVAEIRIADDYQIFNLTAAPSAQTEMAVSSR